MQHPDGRFIPTDLTYACQAAIEFLTTLIAGGVGSATVSDRRIAALAVLRYQAEQTRNPPRPDPLGPPRPRDIGGMPNEGSSYLHSSAPSVTHGPRFHETGDNSGASDHQPAPPAPNPSSATFVPPSPSHAPVTPASLPAPSKSPALKPKRCERTPAAKLAARAGTRRARFDSG